MRHLTLLISLMVLSLNAASRSDAVTFSAHELFAIPFGKKPEMLGAAIDGGNFIFPRDFAMDATGHFYIYDAPHHRIARYSAEGRYEMEFRYLVTARQVFAHPDSHQNLWLLITDPAKGLYYGVYGSDGKLSRSGIFSQFNNFRLHVDDDGALHVVLYSDKDPKTTQSYVLDESRLLMKKDPVAHPPETHHEVRRRDHTFFIDQVPDASNVDSQHVNRITDETHRGVAELRGTIIYVTEQGEIYTRVGDREINIYNVNGTRTGQLILKGLRSACASIRFDSLGNIYELDGVPDRSDAELRQQTPPIDPHADFEDLHYSSTMYGMRMIQWQRD